MANEMNSLPDELFLQIFKYLSSRDIRISIRLVCRRWNQLADDPIFTKNELIIVKCKYQNQYCWSHMIELKKNLPHFLLDRRDVLNFLFKNQRCNQQEKLVPQFWSIYGDRVRSLIFEGCELTFTDLRLIICWCPKVKHISLLWNDALNSDHWIASVPYNLVSEVQSVTSFSIQLHPSGDHELSYRTVHKILSSFPNLEELKIVIDGKYNYFEDIFGEYQASLLPVERSPLNSIAHYILTLKRKLKKLWLVQANSVPYRGETMEFSGIVSQLVKLEELVVTGHQFLCYKMPSSTTLWKSLPKLTFLSLSRIHVSYIRDNIFLTEILDAMPNLQVLHFESDRSKFFSSIFDEKLIEKILASKLKSLHLIHYDSCFCGFSSKFIGIHDFRLNPNHTLEELVIICKSKILEYQRHNRLLNLILKHCKSLRHLAVSHLHDKILQSIFKYQKSLKSLMLLETEICSDLGFVGRNSVSKKYPRKTYSINELKNLELLIIRNMDPERVTHKISSFFVLPKLKSLEMDFVKDCCIRAHKPWRMSDLIQAMSKNILLESLQFHVRMESDLPENLLKQLLISLNKLCFFSLTYELEKEPLEQTSILETIETLFAVCPSLRFIVYGKRIFYRHRRPTTGFEVKEVFVSCLKFDKPREMLPRWYNLYKNQPEMWSNLDQIEFD